jgi:hypothetical protein
MPVTKITFPLVASELMQALTTARLRRPLPPASGAALNGAHAGTLSGIVTAIATVFLTPFYSTRKRRNGRADKPASNDNSQQRDIVSSLN